MAYGVAWFDITSIVPEASIGQQYGSLGRLSGIRWSSGKGGVVSSSEWPEGGNLFSGSGQAHDRWHGSSTIHVESDDDGLLPDLNGGTIRRKLKRISEEKKRIQQHNGVPSSMGKHRHHTSGIYQQKTWEGRVDTALALYTPSAKGIALWFSSS